MCQAKKHTAKVQHMAKMYICRVLQKDAHGKLLAHGKIVQKKVDTPLLIFSAMHIQCIVLLVKIWYISRYFGYI